MSRGRLGSRRTISTVEFGRNVIIADMRGRVSLCCAATVAGVLSLAHAADVTPLAEVGKVYFWPMRSAMDHYLAERVTAEGVFEVVVDPKLAGAVMTDRIDNTFLEALDELFPAPDIKEKEEKKPAQTETQKAGGLAGELQVRPPVGRALSRSQGTLFLVDVRSRRVIWSTYLKEFEASPDKLHKQAQSVVDQLKKRLTSGS